MIIVEAGNTDVTRHSLQQEVEKYVSHVRALYLRRNFIQTAAMQTGIYAAEGNVIVTRDSNLQNDPKDIPRLVNKLIVEDLDLMAGWRKNRKDRLWLRKIPQKFANRLIERITGVKSHDYGCSLVDDLRSSIVDNQHSRRIDVSHLF